MTNFYMGPHPLRLLIAFQPIENEVYILLTVGLHAGVKTVSGDSHSKRGGFNIEQEN